MQRNMDSFYYNGRRYYPVKKAGSDTDYTLHIVSASPIQRWEGMDAVNYANRGLRRMGSAERIVDFATHRGDAGPDAVAFRGAASSR